MTPPSFWWQSLGPIGHRAALPGDRRADVAVVGGGYTGLWTAYYLACAAPELSIVVLEAEHCGFGASGRNGGWASGYFPVAEQKLARRFGADRAAAMHAALAGSVDEVGRVAAAEDIDCHFAKGGTISLARSPAQLRRARATTQITAAPSTAAPSTAAPSTAAPSTAAPSTAAPSTAAPSTAAQASRDDIPDNHPVETDISVTNPADISGGLPGGVFLDAEQARRICGASGVLGGVYRPDCAALHPARLVRGLAAAAITRGVTIYEHTPVRRIDRGRVVTDRGTVTAGTVVRALEGYTSRLPGHRRTLAPVYSLMIATEPLPAADWDRIGLSRRETFTDERHMVIYGQRTADDRLAFGGRGAPYHFGSAVRPGFDRVPAVFHGLQVTLREMFGITPPIAHRWGGPLGIPRDWMPSVGLEDGMAWAGGYVGDGVAAANLAGRTLRDLILGVESDLTALPWVGHRSRRWEPEPLRWLGINAALQATHLRDAMENRSAG